MIGFMSFEGDTDAPVNGHHCIPYTLLAEYIERVNSERIKWEWDHVIQNVEVLLVCYTPFFLPLNLPDR